MDTLPILTECTRCRSHYHPGDRHACVEYKNFGGHGYAELPAKDPVVNRPDWYAKFKVEPITFCMENGFEFWRGNIIKYAARAGSKTYDGLTAAESEIRDLEKARRYAEMRINQLKGQSVL